ncbi:uncharacterized protein LOC119431557 [Dermacentor silvarum]|uniref:uncharacterized protein LOC119431557 n=1 Tax=Dermacentor silvarum TaxID=543639 RepID=UPI002100E9B2|nr:uncharacterized protein LOC119431557 [Dermacentor silvarum]
MVRAAAEVRTIIAIGSACSRPAAAARKRGSWLCDRRCARTAARLSALPMGGGQLEDAAASSRRQQQHSAGPPSSAAADAALLTADALSRGGQEVAAGGGRDCDTPQATTTISGDGNHNHPLVWLAILKVGLLADPAWSSGDMHERARRLWLAFHRLEPPDGHLRQMAVEAAPPWEPLAATLWKSIAAVRDLWEQQPPATATHTTLAAAALFLWQECAHWPGHEGNSQQSSFAVNSRRATCCCSCCPHQGPSWSDAALLQATANDYELPTDKGPRWQMDYDWGLRQAKLLHAVWATSPCPAMRCCPNVGKPWPWEGAELLLPLVLSHGLSWAALVRAGTAPCA